MKNSTCSEQVADSELLTLLIEGCLQNKIKSQLAFHFQYGLYLLQLDFLKAHLKFLLVR